MQPAPFNLCEVDRLSFFAKQKDGLYRPSSESQCICADKTGAVALARICGIALKCMAAIPTAGSFEGSKIRHVALTN